MENIQRFITAGNATFTLKSAKTGTHYTYRVRVVDNGMMFVSTLIDNGEYIYLGYLRNGRLWAGKKGRSTDVRFKGFDWFWAALCREGEPPSAVEFIPSGRCGRCGRELTTPESVAAGLGPECIKR